MTTSTNFRHQDLAPNYSFVFNFEDKFEHANARDWFSKYWHVSFYAVALYMIVVFGGTAYMSNRSPYKLRRLLTIWNVGLAVFSIAGSLRTVPELLHVLRNIGFYHSTCSPSFIEDNKPGGFWTFLFALSKVPELGDTVFIVLRKQKLIFLHWYHHITVLLYTWYTYSEYTGSARWFVTMNFCVHSLMYSYYALKALGVRLPKPLAMLITLSQIAQMIMGAFVIWYAYYRKSMGDACNLTDSTATLGLIMYLSYFALFAQFFYNAYFSAPRKGKTAAVQDGQAKRKSTKQE